MKKNFLLMGLLVLGLGFAATSCDNDDDDGNNPPPVEDDNNPSNPDEDEPSTPGTTINFEDYSELIGASYSTLFRQFGEATMSFDNFYYYTFEEGNVTALTVILNPANQTAYTVMEMLDEEAYTVEDLTSYFGNKYVFYGCEEEVYEDEDSTFIYRTYSYGNTEDAEDATLLITFSDNTSVAYINPQNMPEEPEITGLGDMEPVAAVENFLGENINDILDEYGDAFMNIGMYMATIEDGTYLDAIALMVEDETVTSVILLYCLDDEEIINYYTENGYECTQTGVEVDEEGYEYTTYEFVNTTTGIKITYSDARGAVTFLGE